MVIMVKLRRQLFAVVLEQHAHLMTVFKLQHQRECTMSATNVDCMLRVTLVASAKHL